MIYNYPQKFLTDFFSCKDLLVASYYIQVPALTSCVQGIEFNRCNSNMRNKGARQNQQTRYNVATLASLVNNVEHVDVAGVQPILKELHGTSINHVSVTTPTTEVPCMLNISILLTRTYIELVCHIATNRPNTKAVPVKDTLLQSLNLSLRELRIPITHIHPV